MNKRLFKVFSLVTILALTLVALSMQNAQAAGTTYTWNQTGIADWSISTNWTPTRTSPASTDILQFNGGGTATVTGVPAQTIAQLILSNNSIVNLQAAAANTLTIAGDTGTDLDVPSGSALNMTGTSALTILVSAGATGSISGNMTCSGGQSRLNANDASGITFNSGTTFTQASGCTGNAFTAAGTANAIVFASGSSFVQQTGANPFGLAAPNSKVVFQTGSLFLFQQNAAPSFSGRTYANFEINFATYNQTSTGGGAFTVDNLTMTAGVAHLQLTNITIKGNISVASGQTLDFNPTGTATVTLGGSSTQTISGAGTLTFNSNANINVTNTNGITLQKDITINGTLTLGGDITTGSNTLTEAGTSAGAGDVVGNLKRSAFVAGTSYAFGNPNVSINFASGTLPTDVTINLVKSAPGDFMTAVNRTYTITPNGGSGFSATLRLHYLDSELNGNNENTLQLWKFVNSAWAQQGSSSADTTANWVELSGVTDFSRWTLAAAVTSTNPTGSGAANPSTVSAGASTLLTVAVTPGTNPTSTGLAVTGDLTSIGGSATQQFFDDGSNGDVTVGDNIFSFEATVDIGTTVGAKSLPITITDAQLRTGSTTIALTVQPAAIPPGSIVVSQVYGGGGNAGATFKNDFIELFNRTNTTISINDWSVQYSAATGTSSWQVTTLSGSIAPGKYYLVQEAAGSGGTVNLPAPDATGSIPMSATQGKVILASNSTGLSGACPTGSSIIDLVGYGSTANCFEGSGPAPTLSNTTAALRVNNGCTDMDNNAADFLETAPNPRNSSSAFNDCSAPAPSVSIHDIQGATHISPYNGQVVANVPGIVTAKKSNGFWMQEPNPDASDSTSEGIFVFTISAPTVNIGDLVSVNGTVSEFRPGGNTTGNLTSTEIASPTVLVQSSGNATPAPILVGTGGRVPPNTITENDSSTGNVETNDVFDPAEDGIDFWESLEGMLVQINNPVVVGPPAFSGEIPIVGDLGANAALLSSRGGVIVQPGNFNPERVVLHDAINTTFLTNDQLNVGDHVVGSVVGVMDYNFGNFFFETTGPVTFTSGGLQREVTTPQTSDQLAIGTFNVENLSPNDPQSKFDTLASLIVNNLKSPDVIGVEEIQDNNGAPASGNCPAVADGVVDASQTWSMLITAIQAKGGPTYDYRQINPVDCQDGGAPGGNIRQGFLFNPARTSFIDRPYTGTGNISTDAVSVVNGADGPQLSWSPGRIDPTNSAWDVSRKPIAGEFMFNGHHVFVVANHFKSKGGDDPLMGFHQPPVASTAVQRIQQAQLEHDFLQNIFSLDANTNVVVVGDLNDFQFSTSVKTLTGESVNNAILNDLISTLPSNERYTYDFEGNSETLDHILISNHLFNSVPFTEDVVHVNSEFWDQASDHEPEVADLTLPQVNRAPVAVDDSYSTNEDTPLNVPAPGVLGNDTDADNNALTATLVSDVSHGTLTLNSDGSFNYTPDANYNGSDSFTYKANDGTVDSNVATVSITVNAVNDSPVCADPQSGSTSEDTALNSSVACSDVDNDALTYSTVSNPSHGSLTLNGDGTFTYTPASNYNGSDSFTFKANDGTADSNVATFNITITAVNDAPVAANDSYSTNEDTTLNTAAPGVLANDTDVDSSILTAVLVTGPSHGSLTLNSNGSFSYTPSANYNGSDSFTYKANDGTANSNVATVSITVNAVNDPPVANPDSATIAKNSSVAIFALANDFDVDGDTLTVVSFTQPAHGTVAYSIKNNNFRYTPTNGFKGTDSFTYTISDGHGGTATTTVTITVK